MSNLLKRLGRAEAKLPAVLKSKDPDASDVLDLFRENGLDRALEILRERGASEDLMQQIYADIERARQENIKWKRERFGEEGDSFDQAAGDTSR